MKKILFALLIMPILLFGQTYPKDAIEPLVGKEIKLLPSTSETVIKNGYYNFYDNPDLSFRSRIKAKHEKFSNQLFQIKSFKKNAGDSKDEISIELYNKKIGTVYYGYKPFSEGFWIFEVIGGLSFHDGYFCRDIEIKEDKFTGVKKYNSPTDKHVFFIKEKDVIYLYLKSHGKTLNINPKGIIILLDDGSKIENNTSIIDVKTDGYGDYNYSVLFPLTADEIKKLSEHQITDYRLYVYDFKIDVGEGWFYREYLKCLTKTNSN